eukprot:gene12402-12537_t
MEDTRFAWNKAFLEALDFDAWGQLEEAVNCYHRLQVATAVEHAENMLELPAQRCEAIGHLATILRLRMQELNSGTARGIGLSQMQALKPFVAKLIVSDVSLPKELLTVVSSAQAGVHAAASDSILQQQRHLQAHQAIMRSSVDNWAATIPNTRSAADSVAESTSKLAVSLRGTTVNKTAADLVAPHQAGTLRPPPDEPAVGDIFLSISLENWAVKGASSMQDPHLLITVRNKAGKLLEAVQESPVVASPPFGEDKLVFGFTWHMQTPLNVLQADAAVFFELRHYKPAKHKKSVKCYAYLEMAELVVAGPAVLEAYKKPADYKRSGVNHHDLGLSLDQLENQ